MPTRTPIAETLHGPLASVGDDAGVRIRLDRSSLEPLSEQLSTAIAERIRRGSLVPGDRLPTVRALAEDLELAPNTVAKAYRALEDQGLIVGRGRHGSFVADRLPKRLTDRELRLGDAADAFVRRGKQLGFDDGDIRRAVSRALGGRPSS
jgi:DNA-binding transcriptional regulator YhcF (GntR family)